MGEEQNDTGHPRRNCHAKKCETKLGGQEIELNMKVKVFVAVQAQRY